MGNEISSEAHPSPKLTSAKLKSIVKTTNGGSGVDSARKSRHSVGIAEGSSNGNGSSTAGASPKSSSSRRDASPPTSMDSPRASQNSFTVNTQQQQQQHQQQQQPSQSVASVSPPRGPATHQYDAALAAAVVHQAGVYANTPTNVPQQSPGGLNTMTATSNTLMGNSTMSGAASPHGNTSVPNSFSLISGGDVEFLLPVDDGGIIVNSSSDVNLIGPFTLDRWPLFTTQGLVSDGVRDGFWYNFTLTPDADFPAIDQARFKGSRALFFNESTRRTLPGQVLAVTSALGLEPIKGTNNWKVSVTFHANPTLTIPTAGVLCALTPSSGSTSVHIFNSTGSSSSGKWSLL
jgi:hypothetical protein